MRLLTLIGLVLIAGCARNTIDGGGPLVRAATSASALDRVHDLELTIRSIVLDPLVETRVTFRCAVLNVSQTEIRLHPSLSVHQWLHTLELVDRVGRVYGLRQRPKHVTLTWGEASEEQIVLAGGDSREITVASNWLQPVRLTDQAPVKWSELPDALAWAGAGYISGGPHNPSYRGVMVGSGTLYVVRP
jgi:hypothetical protein